MTNSIPTSSSSTSPTSAPPPHLGPPNASTHKYPLSLVWTPIPLLSWIFPFIGHVGICSLGGEIHDFSGPYTITRQNMLFGWPTRYLPLELDYRDDGNSPREKEDGDRRATQSSLKDHKSLATPPHDHYDDTLQKVSDYYEARVMYNFFAQNCHHYCADVLNEYSGRGSLDWNYEKYADFTEFDLHEADWSEAVENASNNGKSAATPPKRKRTMVSLRSIENDWMFQLTKSCTQWIFGKDRWNIVMIAWLAWWYGQYVSTGRKIYTLLPVFVTWGIILLWIGVMLKLVWG